MEVHYQWHPYFGRKVNVRRVDQRATGQSLRVRGPSGTVIVIAGAAFGYAKYKTGSTAASTLLHSGFNLVGAIAYIFQWEHGAL